MDTKNQAFLDPECTFLREFRLNPVLLCRLGNHLQLFASQQKQEILQQNRRFDDKGWQRVNEVVLERLGIML